MTRAIEPTDPPDRGTPRGSADPGDPPRAGNGNAPRVDTGRARTWGGTDAAGDAGLTPMDLPGLLRRAVDEAVRLLGAGGAMIGVMDKTGRRLVFAHESGLDDSRVREWRATLQGHGGRGLIAGAMQAQRALVTGDYASDVSFEHLPGADRAIRETGIRSLVAAPLVASGRSIGVLAIFDGRPDAFGERDVALAQALADHAAAAVANAALVDRLEKSHEELARRAAAHQALGTLAASLTSLRDPSDVLQRTVEEANRLLGADGAALDLVNRERNTIGWAYDAGFASDDVRRAIRRFEQPIGGGLVGTAAATGQVVVTGENLADAGFRHLQDADDFMRSAGVVSMVAAPLPGGDAPLGVLALYSRRPDAFGSVEIGIVETLAGQAAAALTNARLIAELDRSRAELARRAASERSLREIAARIAAIRDPDAVLQQVVDEAHRLLGSDGAHLSLMAEDGSSLVPVVAAGEMDDETRAWLRTQRFPVGAGMNGLAAQLGEPVSTYDYLLDRRIPHERDDHAVAARLGLRAVAVAPLRAPGGEIVGTLAISYEAPREIDGESIALLQVLADHAAIAVTNSRLDRALRESEERHRFLLEHSPDSIFSVDADGRIAYLSESTEGLVGWRPDEMVGRPLADFIPPESHPQAGALWDSLAASPTRQVTLRMNMLRKDGRQVAVEARAVGVIRDGAFAGILGVNREIGRQVRLEGELRESEARYRYLARASPDVVWHVDREGRILFMSDRLEPLTGWRPEEVVGQHFGYLTHPADLPVSAAMWEAVQAQPGDVHTLRVRMPVKAGGFVPVEIWVTGQVADGAFSGAHGSIRDTRERDRLERELRESEARYRFLLDNSPDVIFSADAEGRFTFLSDSIERVTGWSAVELAGQHFSRLIHPDSREEANLRWAAAMADPALVQIFTLNLVRRDGGSVPVEVNSLTMTVEGRFAGLHGSVRDVSERNRLERDLRQQAAELAASAERAHLARELHDSVTQALFSMTLQTRSAELLLAKDPQAAAEKLVALRDLQRDALAEMRSLIFELRPGGLEQQGLVRALRTHAAAVQGRIGLPITVEAELADPSERLPLELEEAFYRIAQEAIHNVVRHAGAGHVRVSLLRAGDRVHLSVVDDGAGFDPSRVARGHLGLDGMRARAEKVGGRFLVSSRPGHGTRIEVVALSPLGAGDAPAGGAAADEEPPA